MIDSSESDSTSLSSPAAVESDSDTVDVQTVTVQLDSHQIALYRGNREYQTITVENYAIGIP